MQQGLAALMLVLQVLPFMMKSCKFKNVLKIETCEWKIQIKAPTTTIVALVLPLLAGFCLGQYRDRCIGELGRWTRECQFAGNQCRIDVGQADRRSSGELCRRGSRALRVAGRRALAAHFGGWFARRYRFHHVDLYYQSGLCGTARNCQCLENGHPAFFHLCRHIRLSLPVPALTAGRRAGHRVGWS